LTKGVLLSRVVAIVLPSGGKCKHLEVTPAQALGGHYLVV
jgi:hypothetical protein